MKIRPLGFLLAALFAATSSAEANCGATAATGTARVSHVPTDRVDNKLTVSVGKVNLTAVRETVTSKSTVSEVGVECELGYGFSATLSGFRGLHAGVDRTVYFPGYSTHGVTLGTVDLFDLKEAASMHAVRVSLLKHFFEDSLISPFLRAGFEHVTGTHTAAIPLPYKGSDGQKVISITYEKAYKGTWPYLGAGADLLHKGPFVIRAEYQIMSIKPRIDAFMIGAVLRFQF